MTTAHHDRGDSWHGELLDLDAYFERLGHTGDRVPTLACLRALHRAHTTSIPFENVSAVLGIPLPLDIESVQDKLVRSARGGYCYEHVSLFAAALERLGFRFTALTGRVSLGADKILPATHAVLAVTACDDDRTWLCDVGFGGGPLEPVELADGAEADFDGWRFRMERRPDAQGFEHWWLHQYGADGWVDRHTFTLNPQYPIDYTVGSHFVGTHPRSPFVKRLIAQQFSASRHHQIDGLNWITTLPDGTRTEQKIEPEDLQRVLREEFGIVLDADVVTRLTAGPESR
ncbi:arylamine N-acetyltransferase [Streptomyces sp. NBC_01565]|uniref:arylamine N-acetyltransferase family protein n=1 Tax=unclassified Streptomyces TaxID=2593676 RepID=UPI00224ED69C|nr:arylamine N-acetyltransferase [Streptomyces sp. NBC_01565]MCX4539429.1 arylamine N-acetyltransferase [Streptomyces sp. NBC_01565]